MLLPLSIEDRREEREDPRVIDDARLERPEEDFLLEIAYAGVADTLDEELAWLERRL
jgi:hypothetical protein